MQILDLIALAEKWEGVSRRKFLSAERQKEDNILNIPTGQQFIEHGAMCYFNCARELRECLAALSPSSITTQERDQTMDNTNQNKEKTDKKGWLMLKTPAIGCFFSDVCALYPEYGRASSEGTTEELPSLGNIDGTHQKKP